MMNSSPSESRIGIVPQKRVEVAIAVIFGQPGDGGPDGVTAGGGGRVLICRRKANTVLGGYWEFPGGKCNPDEPPADCAIRETWEETGLRVRAVRELPLIEHVYPHAHVRLHPFICELVGGSLELREIAEGRWIEPREILGFQFPEANRALLAQIAEGTVAISAG
jgi:mutator protein MutT